MTRGRLLRRARGQVKRVHELVVRRLEARMKHPAPLVYFLRALSADGAENIRIVLGRGDQVRLEDAAEEALDAAERQAGVEGEVGLQVGEDLFGVLPDAVAGGQLQDGGEAPQRGPQRSGEPREALLPGGGGGDAVRGEHAAGDVQDFAVVGRAAEEADFAASVLGQIALQVHGPVLRTRCPGGGRGRG